MFRIIARHPTAGASAVWIRAESYNQSGGSSVSWRAQMVYLQYASTWKRKATAERWAERIRKEGGSNWEGYVLTVEPVTVGADNAAG